ncbi:MAG: S8 family serine peptidase [Burkholderiaceae bacterium]
MPSKHLALTALALSVALAFAAAPAEAAKIAVKKEADLPRFSYAIPGPASKFVEADDAAFGAFAAQVSRDVDKTLAEYQVDDHSMLGELLNARLDAQELAHDYAGGLKTIAQLRALEDKPAAKLISGLYARARLQAAIDAGAESGPAYEAAFRKHYAEAIAPLPWAIVQDSIKSAYGSSQLASRALMLGHVQSELDPAAAKSGALDAGEARELLEARIYLKEFLPISAARAEVLHAYIAKNQVSPPEIWSAREVTLTAADKTTPVNVGIWDSGVDVALFPDQLFTDDHPTASGTHGLAFDDEGNPSKDWLYPLTKAQVDGYPSFREEVQGRIDLQNGVDSKAARDTQQLFRTLSPEQMHERNEIGKVLGFYAHGTHCAGIAVRGNPAARLVVARFDDQLPDFPFQPTEAWVRKMGADFQQMADYFRTRHVRVVNMSWGDDVSEFETWLSKTGGGGDAQARKAKAAALFALWKEAIENAIKSAPDTLFVTAAGNSDSDAGFLEDVPASLHLPNLIAVGAVNKAGEETSFTSHGDTVLAHADGFQVDSFVPGGARVPFSGTSMASPNVVNLAAKLIALDPTLTPAQTIALIRQGATTSDDGRRHLIDEKKSVALLRTRMAAR